MWSWFKKKFGGHVDQVADPEEVLGPPPAGPEEAPALAVVELPEAATEPAEETEQPEEEPEVLSCSICGKSGFKNDRYLRTHMTLTHQKKNPKPSEETPKGPRSTPWRVRLESRRVIELDVLANDAVEASDRAISFAYATIARAADEIIESQDRVVFVKSLGPPESEDPPPPNPEHAPPPNPEHAPPAVDFEKILNERDLRVTVTYARNIRGHAQLKVLSVLVGHDGWISLDSILERLRPRIVPRQQCYLSLESLFKKGVLERKYVPNTEDKDRKSKYDRVEYKIQDSPRIFSAVCEALKHKSHVAWPRREKQVPQVQESQPPAAPAKVHKVVLTQRESAQIEILSMFSRLGKGWYSTKYLIGRSSLLRGYPYSTVSNTLRFLSQEGRLERRFPDSENYCGYLYKLSEDFLQKETEIQKIKEQGALGLALLCIRKARISRTQLKVLKVLITRREWLSIDDIVQESGSGVHGMIREEAYLACVDLVKAKAVNKMATAERDNPKAPRYQKTLYKVREEPEILEAILLAVNQSSHSHSDLMMSRPSEAFLDS